MEVQDRRATRARASAAPVVDAPVDALIAELVPGQKVDRVFACMSRTEKVTRPPHRQPYLDVELRDRSGTISGQVFDKVEEQKGAFMAGDTVRVVGLVERYQGTPVIKIATILTERPDNPELLLPTSFSDAGELVAFLRQMIPEMVFNHYLLALLAGIFGDAEMMDAVSRSPCTQKGHHSYLGGLLQHIYSLARLVTTHCEVHPEVNADVLMTAVVVHDLGKTRAFDTEGGVIKVSDEGHLCSHEGIAVEIVKDIAGAIEGFPDELLWALIHCIETHHNPLGRPFQTVEAKALFALNAADAGIDVEIRSPRSRTDSSL